ncbi:MAG: nucleotide sugar dehydrogenase, partial [Myxococcota bacterium]
FLTADAELAEAARTAHEAGNLTATSDPAAYESAVIIIIDIPLDLNGSAADPQVDFGPLRDAIRTVAGKAAPGTLILLETTVPPGTCAHVIAPILADEAAKRGFAEDSFLLAHSYERVMPGRDYLSSIVRFWRVYAGHTEAAADECERFLSSVIHVEDFPLTRLGSTTASETAKLMENSYRAANIALVDEWARFAEAVEVDLFEVVDAIRVRPTHSNIRQPGFGVGGYCLTKDPLFARVGAREIFNRPDLLFPFAELTVRTNREMPLATIAAVRRGLGGELNGKRVALLGIAYREDVSDTRFSPAQTFVEVLRAEGAEVSCHDPMVEHWLELDEAVGPAFPDPADVDALVIGVAHSVYREVDWLSWLKQRRPTIIDANRVIESAQVTALRRAGIEVIIVGSGR